MPATFLMDGTGKQLFEFSIADERHQMSTPFLHPLVRRILGWTPHEQVFDFERLKQVRHVIAIVTLVIDAPLAIFAKKGLFIESDTRQLKTQPGLSLFTRNPNNTGALLNLGRI